MSADLHCFVARDHATVRACQRLRYQVFADELGAHIEAAGSGLDADLYDAHCRHLVVREASSGRIVACTRLLSDADAGNTGGFYSRSEFHLGQLPLLAGSKLEVGRTCVHPDYRSGRAITCLWTGLAQLMREMDVDFLLGCASVDMADGGTAAWQIYHAACAAGQVRADLGVTPRVPLRPVGPADRVPRPGHAARALLPPLLRAYLSLGAKICGEPSWDRAFGVADMLVLLDRSQLAPRYARYFLDRSDRELTAKP